MRYSSKTLVAILGILSVVILGFLGTTYGVKTITTTTTTLVTLPGSVYTTTMEIGGTYGTAVVQYPDYVVINVVRRPDRTCTVQITPLPPEEQVVEIPAQTVTIPGTTFSFSTVMEQTVFVTTGQDVEPAYTTTSTGFEFYEAATTYTATYGENTFTTVVSMPVQVYAEIVKSCEALTVEFENTFMIEEAPATVLFVAAFAGTTFTIPGVTYTVPQFDNTMMNLPPTTKTTVEEGTTYTHTTSSKGTTYTTTLSLPPTTVTTVVTEAGEVVTSTVVITTTVEEGTTGGAVTSVEETTEAMTETEATEVVTTAPAETTVALPSQPSPPMDILTIAIISVVAIVIVGLAVGFFILRR